MSKKLIKIINVLLVIFLVISCFVGTPTDVEAKRKRARRAGTTQTYRYRSTTPKRRAAPVRRSSSYGRVSRPRYSPRPKARVSRPKPRPKPRRVAPARKVVKRNTPRRKPVRRALPKKRAQPRKAAKRTTAKKKAVSKKKKSTAKKKSSRKTASKKKATAKKKATTKKKTVAKKATKKKNKPKKLTRPPQKQNLGKPKAWQKKGKKVAKSAAYAIGDIIGINDGYTLLSGKDIVTGKKASRLKAAGWLVVGLVPVGKLGKAFKIVKYGAKGSKAAKVAIKASKVVSKKGGKTVAKKAAKRTFKKTAKKTAKRNTKKVVRKKAVKNTTKRKVPKSYKKKATKKIVRRKVGNKTTKKVIKKNFTINKRNVKNKTNPLAKTRYTNKVKQQMKSGDYHGFPESVDAFGGDGKISKITGGDGKIRTKLEISGTYKGKSGIFEYIIESNGNINHRLFRPKK